MFVFSNISATQITRLLRPHELAAMIRKKYAEAQRIADEEAAQQADLTAALEEVGEDTEGKTTTAEGSAEGTTDGAAAGGENDARPVASNCAPTSEETALMAECACNDPAEEAERRSTIIRSVVFGDDTQLGAEFGDDQDRTSVLLEFLLGCIHFAEMSQFNDAQVSVVFAIAERLFSFARSPVAAAAAAAAAAAHKEQQDEGKKTDTTTPTASKHQWSPRHDSYTNFASMVRQHAVPDPITHQRIFNASHVEQISDFFSTTFFRHYKAYEYAFTVERRTTTTAVNVAVGGPMDLPPLSQAEEIFMTAAEKRALVEAERKQNAMDDMEKNAALRAADAALNELEGKEGSFKEGGSPPVGEEAESSAVEGGGVDITDDRLLREINKRVTAETKLLELEVADLKEVAESFSS